MIKYITGNLLESKAQALVNTVNTVGVMGKGIALQFKNKFHKNYNLYKEACKNKSFKTGEVLVVHDRDLLDEKLIINFPTKAHWKGASKYEYIRSGMVALRQAILDYQIESVAMPPLGCGNGGLDWELVKPIISEGLKDLQTEVFVYLPSDEIKAVLQNESVKKQAKLTPARAMLLYLMFNYEALGEQSSLFVANKLAYFLQRSGEKLKLNFTAHHYGPYTVQLNHVLLSLNGTYLSGLEQNQAKPFDVLTLKYEQFETIKNYIERELSAEQRTRLDNVISLIRGFESTFSLELLATTDFLLENKQSRNVPEVLQEIREWSTRKTALFDSRSVEIAYSHLQNYQSKLFSSPNQSD